MNNWNTIQNELLDLNSSLASKKNEEVYAVPDGYFDQFAGSMLMRIHGENASASDELNELSPLLAGISKKMPFSLPNGYFEQSSEEISALIEDEKLPEFLNGAERSMPYSVPNGYFETFAVSMASLVVPQQEGAKVVSMFSKNWKRLAAAAIIIGVIGMSSIFYFNGTSSGPDDGSQQWVAKKLKNVSDKELEEFINTSDIPSTTIAKSEAVNKSEIRTLLNDVPDKELEEFLNGLPADNEDLLIIN